MEDNKKETILPKEVKDYYTKEEVEKLISDKLNDNLKDLLIRFNNVEPKKEEKKEEVKKELTEKELMF